MDIARAALSLVLHRGGKVSRAAMDDLIFRYRKNHNIIIDRKAFSKELSKAENHYKKSTARLFVCAEASCLNKTFLDLSEPSLRSFSQELGCAVEATGCHWKCAGAPVFSLKVRQQLYTFTNCSSTEAIRIASNEIQHLLVHKG
jgi:hypothetical protein